MISRALFVFSAGLLMAQPAADPAATARKALDLLLSEHYSDLTPMFTPAAQKAFPEAALGKLGVQFKSWGAVESVGAPASRKAGPNTVVTLPVKFATRTIDFQFGVNPQGLISAMFFNQGEVIWQRPPYSKPDSFREREVTFGEDPWKLPGTFTVPTGSGPFPAVVLVHGSGPNDRDETIFATRVFKDLAEGLASRGIAVLRYEKRTKQYAAKFTGVPATVGEETVDDAVAAAAVLRAQPEVDPKRVFLLGHALGGYLAPRIAAEDGKFAGLIIFAGHSRPMEDLMVEQSEYLGTTGPRLESIKMQAARVKALDPADASAPTLMGAPVSYWLDLKGYDAPAEAKKLAIPLLILQGERDFQVTMNDFTLWKSGLAGRKDVTFKSYPALNHLFIAGEGKSTDAEYRKPGHVDPEVIDDIAKWIAR